MPYALVSLFARQSPKVKMKNFDKMGFHGNLVKILDNANYQVPTPIQAQAIPLVLEGHDIIGIAQTGTGKTAAFALPIIDRLIKDRQAPIKRGCRALILAPTRELCNQIATSFVKYSKGTGIQIAAVYGGVSYKPQINALIRGVDVLVATPGRLIDHIDEGNVRLNLCDMFVLDEVDQMLDLGFVNPIRKVVKKLPEVRQNLFFSATMPKEIQKFANELLTNPKRVEVAPVSSTAERVEQTIIQIETAKKRAMLSELLLDQSMSRILVFTKTKHGADKVAKHLGQISVRHAVIHGDKSQRARQDALEAFRGGRVRALVATDVAARGIDIKDVTHVLNFDMPLTPEAYVHRIGRTARAEASGFAISLCSNEEANLLRSIEKLTARNITKIDRRKDASIMADKRLTSNENEVSEEMSDIRPPRAERSERSDRGGRNERSGGERSGRGRSDRNERPNRSDRAERPAREDRPSFNDRPAFAERPAYNEGAFTEAVETDIYAEPRKEGRFENRGGPRGASRGAPRGEGRPEGRGDNRGQRGEARNYGDRPQRSEGRSEGRPEGRSEGRNEGRGNFGRGSFSGGAPSGAPRGRSFDDRPQRSNYNPATIAPAENSNDAPWEFSKRPRNHSGQSDGNRAEFVQGEKRPFNRPRTGAAKPQGGFGARADGGKPHYDRPKGRSDRPHSDRPHSDRPRSERPQGDRPFGERSFGDRSRNDRPQSDRPRGDRPQGDRGQGRPSGDRPARRREFA